MDGDPDIVPRLEPLLAGPGDSVGRAPRPARLGVELAGPGPGEAAVVIGLDGSDTSWDAFWWGCGEARRLGKCAVVVFVSPTIDAGSGLAWAVGCPCDYTEIHARATDRALELENEVLRHAAAHSYDVMFVHAHGDAAHELLHIAATLKCDLIVVGSSTKAFHRLAGSLGRRLTRTSMAPVVAVVP